MTELEQTVIALTKANVPYTMKTEYDGTTIAVSLPVDDNTEIILGHEFDIYGVCVHGWVEVN